MKRSKAPSSGAHDSVSDDDASVTSLGEPGLLRERAPEIERGYVLAGRYQVEAVIGKGGSGVVLRAFDRTAQMPVAIKVLKSELAKDERWSKRFARELRLGRPIRHPNVCRIFDINEADGHKFLTMELATGGTLRDVIKKGEPLRPFEERLADAAAAIGGLAAIHEAGIVHRDVKPDNMLRMEDGRLAISDFGLATDLSNSQMVTVMVGTPHYMAPEVRAGEPATTRSDVWSLGVVLHEIFFGRRPERRSSASKEGMSRPPAPLTSSPVERAMLALCETCLADKPFERPNDAQAVRDLFEEARSSPGRRRMGRARRYWAASIGALAVLGLALTAGPTWKTVLSRRRSTNNVGVVPLAATGEPADWTGVAKTVATIRGPVHCFSIVDRKTARIVWGSERQAEDIDLESGLRKRSHLRPETYRIGCPEVAPETSALLFVALTSEGGTHIRIATTRDGSDSKELTPGVEPVWLGTGDEFAYSIDPYHAAIYSLRTRSFTLLPEPGMEGRWVVSEKVVSQISNAIALSLMDDSGRRAVAIYDGGQRSLKETVFLAAGYRMDFRATSDQLLVSYTASPTFSTLALLDWEKRSFRNLGRYGRFDLIPVRTDPDLPFLLARQRTKDAWLNRDDNPPLRLTRDGRTFSAARSGSGEMLLSSLGDDGRFAIWRRRLDAAPTRVTDGPLDAHPAFSSDGTRWAYVDYRRRSVMVCDQSDRCRSLLEDPMVPAWPTFSPADDHLAYVTQAGAQRVVIVSLRDGSSRQLGASFAQCPPVWSSPTTLWIFEGSAKQYVWVERDLGGVETGRRIAMGSGQHDANQYRDENQCWPRAQEAMTSSFPKIRIIAEEEVRLLRIPTLSVVR